MEFETIAQQYLNAALSDLGYEERVVAVARVPFAGSWGYASPICHQIAKTRGPAAGSAQELAEALRTRIEEIKRQGGVGGHTDAPSLDRVEAVRGFVNLYFEPQAASRHLLAEVLRVASDFGRLEHRGERVMIEYSAPNTHKAFHIGHLRNTALGASLGRIARFAGFDVVTANYIGDIGNHVIKCLWCYLRFHEGEEPNERKGAWLGEIYSEADARITEAEEYRRSVLAYLRSLGADPALVALRESAIQECDRLLDSGRQSGGSGEDIALVKAVVSNGIEIKLEELRDQNVVFQVFSAVERSTNGATDQLTELCAQQHLWEYPNQIRDLFKRWDAKDPALYDLWTRTREWSLEDFRRIYDELGADFDVWFYESQVEEEGKAIVEDLLSKEVASLDELGRAVVRIDQKLGLSSPGEDEGPSESRRNTGTYGTLPVLRSDGSSLYSTKDLALAKRKFEDYHIDRSIYVVGAPQSFYFQQLFKILELWGFEQAKKCFHLAYELVTLPEGKMASRAGTVVLYDDLAAEAKIRARKIIDEKNPGLDEATKDKVAQQIAVGAMKFSMLSASNNKVITFDWESVLNFEGHSAPYVQYAHARACQILAKAPDWTVEHGSFSGLEQAEVALLEHIAAFPENVARAAEKYSPTIMATYSFELAKRFNDFYASCPVLQAPDAGRRTARLALVAATRQVLRNSLGLVGIDAPDAM